MLRKIKKYIKILKIILRNTLYRNFIYRIEFFVGIITDTLFNIVKISFILVLLNYTVRLGNWNSNMITLLLGTSFLIESIYMFFFFNSHSSISMHVNKGDMDFFLIKPISEMFYLSINNVNFGSGISNIIFAIIYLIKGLSNQNLNLSIFLGYLFMVICGSTIYFCISISVNAISFWTIQANNIFNLFINITDFYRYPGEIFPKKINEFITFILPLQLIAVFPTMYLLNMGNSSWIFWFEIVMTCLMLFISRKILKFAIKNYSSASS